MSNDLKTAASSAVTSRISARPIFLMGSILALMIGVAALPASAQCGGALSDLYARASATNQSPIASVKNVQDVPSALIADNENDDAAIVGLWHTRFVISTPGGDVTIQEAFQIWNAGGTEVHNPNVDTRSSSMCLGVWNSRRQTFNLTHRVWNTDANGVNFGTLHLSEAVKLYNHGQTMLGNFTIGVFDPAGNKVDEFSGRVVGERINVGD